MLFYIIVIAAVLATAAAGAIDLMEKRALTKEHLWNDGLFLLGLAILYKISST